jgi:hypothetical protein
VRAYQVKRVVGGGARTASHARGLGLAAHGTLYGRPQGAPAFLAPRGLDHSPTPTHNEMSSTK